MTQSYQDVKLAQNELAEDMSEKSWKRLKNLKETISLKLKEKAS